MPQLDTNTFIYQYSGVITTLILLYIILSYIVLPVLLRSLFIRAAFLFLSVRSTEFSRLSTSEKVFIHVKPKASIFSLASLFFIRLSYKLHSLIKLFLNFFRADTLITNTSSSGLVTSSVFVFVTINYLVMFLSLDLYDQTENSSSTTE